MKTNLWVEFVVGFSLTLRVSFWSLWFSFPPPLPPRTNILDVQNWRPLTLHSKDYKITRKTLAQRIETVLPKLVHFDQTKFVKGRFIGDNID